MPQMAPYNWLFLFFMFNTIYIYLLSYINFINYNMMSIPPSMKSNKITMYIWKW